MARMTPLLLAIMAFAGLSLPAVAENHTGFGVRYGDEACNNTPDFMTENDITCSAVFSDISVWDFLDTLPRRIPLEELITLNPALEIEGYETVLTGITFIRVK